MCTYCKLAADRCDSGPRRSGEESGFSPDRRGPESEAPRARAQFMHIARFSQYAPYYTNAHTTILPWESELNLIIRKYPGWFISEPT